MAERRDNFDNEKQSEQERLAGVSGGSEHLRAGIEEMSGVKREDLEEAVAQSQQSARAAIDWVQRNYGVLIAAGLGIATVGLVTLLLNRRAGLRNFYEEESSSPTLH